jgi:lysophospholipase L1-like esterase
MPFSNDTVELSAASVGTVYSPSYKNGQETGPTFKVVFTAGKRASPATGTLQLQLSLNGDDWFDSGSGITSSTTLDKAAIRAPYYRWKFTNGGESGTIQETLKVSITVTAFAPHSNESASVSEETRKTYNYNMGQTSKRMIHEKCRLEMVGDSQTENSGFSNANLPTQIARLSQVAQRAFKPKRWRGAVLNISNTSLNLGGTVVQRVATNDVVTSDKLGDNNNSTFIGPGGREMGASLAGFNAQKCFPYYPLGSSTSSSPCIKAFIGSKGDAPTESGGSNYEDRAYSINDFFSDGSGANQLNVSDKTYRWHYYHFVTSANTPSDFNNGANILNASLNAANRPVVNEVSIAGATGNSSVAAFTNGTEVKETITLTSSLQSRWYYRDVNVGTIDLSNAANSSNTKGHACKIVPAGSGISDWGDYADSSSGCAVLLNGQLAIERTDQDGLFVSTTATGGSKATNHLYQPSDANSTTQFSDNGDFSGYDDSVIQKKYEKFEIDTVMITLGTNDASDTRNGESVRDPDNFKANIEAIIQRHRRIHALAQASNSNIQDLRFVLVSIPDWYATSNETIEAEIRARIGQYPEKLKQIAESNMDVGFIDIYNRWKDKFGAYDTYHDVFLANESLGSGGNEGVHASTRGGSEFAEAIWDEVKKAAGEA